MVACVDVNAAGSFDVPDAADDGTLVSPPHATADMLNAKIKVIAKLRARSAFVIAPFRRMNAG